MKKTFQLIKDQNDSSYYLEEGGKQGRPFVSYDQVIWFVGNTPPEITVVLQDGPLTEELTGVLAEEITEKDFDKISNELENEVLEFPEQKCWFYIKE